MRYRGAAIPIILSIAALGCQRHPEKGVVDQYFNAVNSKDTQTLASFAAVSFDKKVDRWAIKETLEEVKTDAPLSGFAESAKKIQADLDANTRAARTYNNDHFVELDAVKNLKAGAPVPPKLQPIKAEWDKFNETDRELKKALANAKEQVEREKRSVTRSVGQVDDVESMKGEMIEKKIELDLTIDGAVKPYVMTVRKYELKREGPRVVSRWVVQNLTPKG